MISCRDYALRLISFKDRTEKEIKDRLLQKGFSEEEAEGELCFLHEYGYINDEVYAKSFAADAVNLKKWGRQRIVRELCRRGIDKCTAETAAENACSDPHDMLVSEMKRRFDGADMGSIKERSRIFAYFARRGFSPSEIRGAMNTVCSFENIVMYDEE